MASPLARQFFALNRTLHIYSSMFGLALMAFFAVTGFMLNHSDWFGLEAPVSTTQPATLPAELATRIRPELDAKTLKDDDGLRRDLELELRAHDGVVGERTGYSPDESQIEFQFVRPAQKTQVVIHRDTGALEVMRDTKGVNALLSDLHKGTEHSGAAWSLVIDISAGILLFAAVSGVILWVQLPKRRVVGIIAGVVGLAGCLFIYWRLIP